MLANEIMTKDVKTIYAANSVHTAIELMVNHGVSGLPVVNEDSMPIGMITEGDLLRRVEYGGTQKAQNVAGTAPILDLEDFIHSHSWRVGDLMTSTITTVTGNETIGTVAQILFGHKIKRVPVIDGQRLIGLISRVDLLRAIVDIRPDGMAPGDEAMERAIKARLSSDLGISPKEVTVRIEGGVARLEGKVSSELQRRAVAVLVENVEGVAGYKDDLSIAV
jgi:CBS domain-containing protein